ncbi:DUF4189 domain-containing protein [Paramagnetospirillum magneticum]|uniref:DUF4189 domain-containing protein n=1 Tax=Paramagnetospirillum magneticum (strain ATCC 700264 / AMB-1) TaxID=342108 RepID=Q2W6C5_PARM1|nr:DUF4189 domain-containing protein [Paramagnetospirillum magneticum]BAE50600.1 hypothetical protein amb1796 [Paramagnetospirillum magneticum AMB-1]
MAKIFFAMTLAFGLLLGSVDARAAGAIAVDDEAGSKADEVGYGIGTGSSREEAGADAMRECKKAGNSNCKVAVRYDTCGAYAASKSYSGIGWGSSEGAAKSNALEACGSGCKVVVADCQ